MIEIERALKQLRLSGVRATLETRLIESQASNLSFIETFSALLQDELDRRQSRLLERRYQLSGLAERASLAEFDWGYNPKIPKRTCFELHTLKFIAECDSALLIGQPGTGKSHIAKAIAYSALRSGLREPVPFRRTPRSEKRYPRPAGSVACDEPETGRRWITRGCSRRYSLAE